jgi:hypothetical protein
MVKRLLITCYRNVQRMKNNRFHSGNVNDIDKSYFLSTGYLGVMLFHCKAILAVINISTVLLLLLI